MPKKQRTTKGPPLSDYEKARLARIAENKVAMEATMKAMRDDRNALNTKKITIKRPRNNKPKSPQKGMCFSTPAAVRQHQNNTRPVSSLLLFVYLCPQSFLILVLSSLFILSF